MRLVTHYPISALHPQARKHGVISNEQPSIGSASSEGVLPPVFEERPYNGFHVTLQQKGFDRAVTPAVCNECGKSSRTFHRL